MPRLLFVTYHYIRPVNTYQYPGIYSISLEQFVSEISKIQNKYYIPTKKEVENHVAGKEVLPEDSVFITFDDGLPEHHYIATEILHPKNICAAFFITSRPYLEKKALSVHKIHWLRANVHPDEFESSFFKELNMNPQELATFVEPEEACKTYPYDNENDAMLKFYINFKLDYQTLDKITSKMIKLVHGDEAAFCAEFYLPEREIVDISDAGHVIGSHGHSHQPWSRLSEEELNRDIILNKEFLKNTVGIEPEWASYPYGRDWAIPKNSNEISKRFKFKISLTLDNGWNEFGQGASKLLRINCNELQEYAAI